MTTTQPPLAALAGKDYTVVEITTVAVWVVTATHRKSADMPAGLIFPASGSGSISDATLSKLSRENDIQGTPHGMRAAFRSWCADENISREIAEACLAHTVKGVEASYQRSDLFKRRVLMERWGEYITQQPPSKVVSLHS
ncbi:MAG: hypothetical protein OXH80_02750 [Nitrospira sp.]|nr:hypothetical protein [Nitrospira sp.]